MRGRKESEKKNRKGLGGQREWIMKRKLKNGNRSKKRREHREDRGGWKEKKAKKNLKTGDEEYD